MILSTHAIVGAAIASFLPSHPTTAFVLGFGSHFVLDAIPHWDYPISSASVNPKIGAPVTFDRALLRDLVVIGSDGLLGILGALLLFASSEGLWSILLGAFGAMLPRPARYGVICSAFFFAASAGSGTLRVPEMSLASAQPEHARACGPQGSRRVSFGDSPTSGFCTPTPGNKRQAITETGLEISQRSRGGD